MADDAQPILAALRQGGLVDITTTGRRTGQLRRIEVGFFDVAGRVYISGSPGTRGWLANLKAEPRLTFHLKGGLTADLPATARIITDADERRPVIEEVVRRWNREPQLDAFLGGSPLIEVIFDDEVIRG